MADQNDGHPLSESNFADELLKRIRKSKIVLYIVQINRRL